MIIIKLVEDNERELRYSDQGVKIRQMETGNVYDNAADYIPCPYTYEETDIPVDIDIRDQEEDDEIIDAEFDENYIEE